MRLWLILGISLTLAACQPADRNTKSVYQRLMAGELVEFDEPGYRRPACSGSKPDWTDIRVSADPERARIVTRNQKSYMNAGDYSCYRVGGQVAISVNGKTQDLGMVRIKKLGLIKLEKLEKRHLKGQYFASSEDFYAYKDAMKFRLDKDPSYKGIVTLLEIDYVPGTATDEKTLNEKAMEEGQQKTFEETRFDGDMLKGQTCDKPWVDLVVPADAQEPVFKGQIGSWYNFGQKNCLAQGQDVGIKSEKKKDSPIVRTLKVAKVKRVRIGGLLPEHFVLPDFDYAVLKKRIEDENTKGQSGWITIVDFAPREQAAPRPAPEGCVDKSRPLFAANVAGNTALVKGMTCFEEGEGAILTWMTEGRQESKAVVVLKQTYDAALDMTEIEFQIIAKEVQP
ncbi:MAG TPA: hypothetical protein PKC28_10155 [Bdellovibrionales bacterium]|nr:hypothetical protein [Bdellovibrionales bacterium]